MKAVDTNLLVYAHREESPCCASARDVLRALVEGAEPWALPFPVLVEFLAVVTHPRIYAPPSPMKAALREVEGLLASPSARLLVESEDSWRTLAGVLAESGTTGPGVHDARVAALCIENGVGELLSVDRDFSRFPRLRAVNPLKPG